VPARDLSFGDGKQLVSVLNVHAYATLFVQVKDKILAPAIERTDNSIPDVDLCIVEDPENDQVIIFRAHDDFALFVILEFDISIIPDPLSPEGMRFSFPSRRVPLANIPTAPGNIRALDKSS